MSKQAGPTRQDVGAAMMAWYADALSRFPEGMVTQAQAATMLGLGRMSISRLVARGYLRAAYFPRPPDIAGVAVGREHPAWLKLAGWLGVRPADSSVSNWPKACYVSFSDVVRLWQASEARQRCRRDWQGILSELAGTGPAGEPGRAEPQERPAETAPSEELETWML